MSIKVLWKKAQKHQALATFFLGPTQSFKDFPKQIFHLYSSKKSVKTSQ